MSFRTYAWFYGSDYQLINLHDAKQKDHPYYNDEQLYGATDVHSFSAHNFVREVTRRVVINDEDNHGMRKIYEQGTAEWYRKFNKPYRVGHSKEIMYEESIEKFDGTFELELPLGFTSVDLFESLVTAKQLAEILIVMYRRDESGKLIPAYHHVFQEPQIQGMRFNVSFDDTFAHRLHCKVHYSKYEYQYYTDTKSNPLTHAFLRKSMNLKISALEEAKAQVRVASEYVRTVINRVDEVFSLPKNFGPPKPKKDITLHQITVPRMTQFYSASVGVGELDNFYFYIAPERMSVDTFLYSLFDNVTDVQLKHFNAANPHVRGMIEPGQMVYVIDTESSVYKKIKPGLDASAKGIDSLRIQVPQKDLACFANDFALLGSFARSVGTKEGVYTARPENLDKMTFGDAASIVTTAADNFFQFAKMEIKAIEEGYKRFPKEIYQLRKQGVNLINKAQVQMLDKLVKFEKITSEMIFEAGVELNKAKYSMSYAVKHWTTTSIRLESLDVLYSDVVNLHKIIKILPPALIYMDYQDTKNKIHEACTIMREDECRKHAYVKWGGFAGGLGGGELSSRLIGIGIAFAAVDSGLVTGGMSAAILSSAIKIVITGFSAEQAKEYSEGTVTILYEYFYEREK